MGEGLPQLQLAPGVQPRHDRGRACVEPLVMSWYLLSYVAGYTNVMSCHVRAPPHPCDKFQPLFLSESRLSGQNMSLRGWPLVANLSNVRPVSVQVLKKQKMPV